MKATPEMILSLMARTATKIGTLNPEHSDIQDAIKDTNHRYWKAIDKVFNSSPRPQYVIEWQDFYRENFGMDIDLTNVSAPALRSGFDRRIVIAKGLTLNQVYDTCAKHFPCWRYVQDLDTAVPTNDRMPSESYVVWFRDRVEADEELKNLSTNMLADQKIKSITLLERMVYELKYFLETGSHLDIKNVTLCSGSRLSGGHVPCADWRGGRFEVDWHYRGGCIPGLRSREAVSL